MIYRSKAPLRLGLAGGGTDVSPYSDIYGGAILNATISLFAHAHIEEISRDAIICKAEDQHIYEECPLTHSLPLGDHLHILKGVYNRIQKDYAFTLRGLEITTFVDAPTGSGLGSSSTLVVALVGAFVEMLKLPLGEYDIAQYAFDIERNDLGWAGGKQDQYAATFGGFNFMEFNKDNHTIVNPLRIRSETLYELENNLVLYYTSTSRDSSTIIKEQVDNVKNKKTSSIDAMHNLKKQAFMMKEALLTGRLYNMGELFDYGFTYKKQMAEKISNTTIDDIYNIARKAGSLGGKISGAGGGGFMIFYCPGTSRYTVINALSSLGGQVIPFRFTKKGLTSWSSNK